jgi:hypothetical protein
MNDETGTKASTAHQCDSWGWQRMPEAKDNLGTAIPHTVSISACITADTQEEIVAWQLIDQRQEMHTWDRAYLRTLPSF